jgi:hypothetical protein
MSFNLAEYGFPLSGRETPRQVPAVRVPIPAVIVLIIAVMGGVWWHGTKDKDFLTPPSAEKLQEVRARVESSFPQTGRVEAVTPEPAKPTDSPEPVVESAPEPTIDLGDLSLPPTLTLYGDRSPQGAAALIALAAALEEKGQFQRALLAWERVLDLSKPSETETNTAISSIKRLRPTLPDWNTDPAKKIPVVLHAGTGKKMAGTLTPVLEQVAREVEKASAGLVKVTTSVTAGKSNAKGASPVALWLSGPAKSTVSTEVLSFTVDSPDALHREVLTTIFQLVRGFLSQTTSYTPPAALAEKENPEDALNHRITRLCWNEFAASLNLPPKKVESPVKKTEPPPRKTAPPVKKSPASPKKP